MFLIRMKARGHGSIATCDDDKLAVQFPERTRIKSIRDTPIGPIASSVFTGSYDKSRVTVKALDARSGNGTKGAWNDGRLWETPLARAAQSVRRLRPQEAEPLAALDERIGEVVEQLRTLRRDRDELVRVAFSRGHKVTQKELIERAERRLAEQQAKREAARR